MLDEDNVLQRRHALRSAIPTTRSPPAPRRTPLPAALPVSLVPHAFLQWFECQWHRTASNAYGGSTANPGRRTQPV